MNTDKNKKIDDILNSIDGIQRAAAPDFFYTRLKAKMEKGLEAGNVRPFLLRPAYAFVAIIIVVLMNAAVLFKSTSDNNNTATETESLQSIAAEYSLTDNNNLYDLIQDK